METKMTIKMDQKRELFALRGFIEFTGQPNV
jgi:hypothetical protein